MESQSNEVDEEQASMVHGWCVLYNTTWFNPSLSLNLAFALLEVERICTGWPGVHFEKLQLKVQHAMADPEIQRMLHDPQANLKDLAHWMRWMCCFSGADWMVHWTALYACQVRLFLKTLQENPAEGQKACLWFFFLAHCEIRKQSQSAKLSRTIARPFQCLYAHKEKHMYQLYACTYIHTYIDR